ncbi:hypothetical protein B0H16DRAFT_1828939 [Mycena metata]|uniref:F-box domain-containing protein n=1 Tax=Mycena metata TaxID=1033252 RepID=A0AAD7J2E6_9AGAR|nr:hypothetical protein B0H16DRAFT_1828939 [Mycena metata]
MDSPFKDILHTNTAPSDEDCQRIRELLAGPRREAAQLTERLHSLIKELTEKRDNLNECIDPHLALISPVRRLPHDVVAEIFAASLPPDRNAVIHAAESPLLLCHICQAWRALALSTPQLWASLHIVGPRDTPRDPHRNLRVTQPYRKGPGSLFYGYGLGPAVHHTPKLHQINEAVAWWLAKSGGLPLSISIVQSCVAPWEADFSILVQTLVQYASRWQQIRIRICLGSRHPVQPLAGLLPIDVPSLETVALEGLPSSVDETFTAFLGANSLRSVSLTKGSSGFPFQTLPWARLRHLLLDSSAACHTAAEGLELLRRCPNLEACALAFLADFDDSPSPVGSAVASPFPCRMQNLRQLSVLDNLITEGTATVDFFAHLDLPNLRSLNYMTQRVEEFPIRPLLSSPQQIQRLGLKINELTSDTLIACIGLLPSLQELALCADPCHGLDTSPDAAFWIAMTPTGTVHHVLCPQLQVMKFTQVTGLPDPLLLEFILARTESHFPEIAQLSKVHGHFSRAMVEDIVPRLDRAIAHGLDLSLEYQSRSNHYSTLQDNTPHTDGRLLSDGWWRGW